MSAASNPHRLIETDDDIKAGIRALRRKCAAMARIHELTGAPPLRRHSAGFEGLARTIVAQQLSAQSAAAIWRRTSALAEPFTAEACLALPDASLREAGLSSGKIRTLRGAADAIRTGTLDFKVSARDLRAALLALRGIGPWTADIYVLFCVGDADAFAPGDLALQIAAQSALELPERPSARELDLISERWRPWRGVAARLLWAYYPLRKSRL